MAIFKCKMCGGALEVLDGVTVCECEYCGTKQTLPKLNDEKKTNLYDRANHFRRNNEFDKAMTIYEQILNEDTSDAEAYWSLVLCKYGIEYVDDPATHEKVPTVNRAQFTSVFADEDYKSAIANADTYQKSVYEDEAKAIDEIQKGILAISEKEEPFDVFICYKETDNNGRRTPDSVLATELYNELTREEFKVFFARITLEDKLGTAYEPYIFAALNSSKVMVVLGTKPEHFNAVWVKNEWSRYLSLIKNGARKMLIPAYKDMDPYDLPEEFSHLQAQDMSKLGFMQDLIRGIKKIAQADIPKTTVVKETVISGGNANTAPLLKRAFMFLEDGDWNSTNEYCEKVLDIDPENATAYLGKLLSELRVRKQEMLKDQAEPFDHSNNYQKAIRFADEKLKSTLTGYIEYINIRNENARLDGIYTSAKNAMSAANTEGAYKEAAVLFESISEFQDSSSLANECYKKAEAARLERERKAEIERKDIAKRNRKIAIITTPIVCAIIAFIIVLNTVIIPNNKYNDAIALMDTGKYTEAIAAFRALNGYKDSISKIEECNINIFGEEVWSKLKSVSVGDTCRFGSYEQDNIKSNGQEDIEWLVLAKEGTKILVISKYALDCQQYNSDADVTWETCTLRKWLNNNFINSAFTADEKAKIPTVTVSADKNPDYSTNPGNATQDQVFLLSITEANKYFSSDSARECKPTEYAVAVGAMVYSSNGNCRWWLRSPGLHQNGAAGIDGGGSVYDHGHSVHYDFIAVRPALWIDLNF